MTNEEHQIIADFIARVGGAATPQQGQWGGASVPATTTTPATTPPALPPIDRDADAFIGDQFNRYPEARYRITQLAFVQEHALVEAQNRIRRLEWELQQSQQAAQQAQQSAQQPHGGGFFSGLFGGGRSQPQPPSGQPTGQQPGGPWGHSPPPPGYQPGYAPPPPQYPPNYNPGLFQRQGSGFLGSALTTAAGVAGGVLAADAIRSMFSPHQGLGFGGGFAPGMASPWATSTTPDPSYVDQGAWTPDPGGAGAIPPPDQGSGPGYVDQGTWDQGGADQGNWNDPSGGADQSGWNDPSGGADPGGGWDDPSGGGGSDDDSLT